MRSIEEIKKELDGYIEYWRKMADSDESGEFRRKNDPVKEYWKGVREALDLPLGRSSFLTFHLTVFYYRVSCGSYCCCIFSTITVYYSYCYRLTLAPGKKYQMYCQPD